MDIYGVIYKAVNRFNGYTYIGQARNFNLRVKGHKKRASLKSSNLFDYDLAKYGDDIRFEIVCACQNQENLDFLESLLIKYYIKQGKSYNSLRHAKSKIRRLECHAEEN